MNIKNNSVEQNCYLDYLVAKYIIKKEENGDIAEVKYNTAELLINNQPIVMISKE